MPRGHRRGGRRWKLPKSTTPIGTTRRAGGVWYAISQNTATTSIGGLRAPGANPQWLAYVKDLEGLLGIPGDSLAPGTSDAPWITVPQFKLLCLQIFKTIGDLSKCVEFASPSPPAVIREVSGNLQLSQSKIFISIDQLAVTFARKLAAGNYRSEREAGAVAHPYLIYLSKGRGANIYTSPLSDDDREKIRQTFGNNFGSKRKKVRKKSSYGTKRKKAKRKRKRKVRKKSSHGTKRKKRKRKSKKKTIPLKDAKVKVAKRKWLGRYGGKVYKLTTLASRFGVSVKRGRGFKKAETVVKGFREKNVSTEKEEW